MPTERLEAFSDGVFAVAITLLVLDLQPPITNHSLVQGLADRWPSFAAFGLSFVIIGIIWVNHHAVFSTLRSIDRPLLFINLALLLSVVLIPFATSLFARYVTAGGDNSHVAAAVFSGSSLLMSLCFNAVYVWIAQHPELRHDTAAQSWSVRSVVRFGLGGAVYAGGVAIAFVSAPLVFVMSALIAAYYVVDQATSPAPAGG